MSGDKARPEPAPRIKRFYQRAEAAPLEGGFGVLLDGRPARTPLKTQLTVPHEVLGAELAGEWQAQDPDIETPTMPLTRLANTAIDGVARERDGVIESMAAYAGSDLICYRASAPEGLVSRQAECWDPIVRWAEKATATRLTLTAGLVAVEQSPDLIPAIARLIADHDDLALAALAMTTTMSGSVLMALALSRRAINADAAWAAAHVDEDWQISQWGEDAEAARRRAGLYRDFLAAARVLDLCRA
ncbi:MAG: ATPase [Rhizobiales bacterium]|nr:ATPase [Hyphomicrobiales bacterium]